MTKFKLVLVAMFAVAALMAQDVVYLYYNNGRVDEVAVSDFGSLSCTIPESTITGEAEITGGTKVRWVQLWENGPKWAKYDVGATKVGEFGGYYCLGGVIDQDPNAEYYDGDEDIQGGIHDTAKNLWGDNWQMPTKADYEALFANCDIVWKTKRSSEYGVAGLFFIGRGDYKYNSIFFPTAGIYYSEGGFYRVGSYGYYWSSTPDGSNYAYSLYFYIDYQNVYSISRNRGCSVRAVLKE